MFKDPLKVGGMAATGILYHPIEAFQPLYLVTSNKQKIASSKHIKWF